MTHPDSELDAEIQKTEARLAELQAQREALNPDKRKAAYRAYLDRLEPGCAGVDMEFTFYAGYNAAEHDLAPCPVVDDGCKPSAEQFADYLAQFYDQRAGAWRSKIIRAIIERDRTLSRAPLASPPWPVDVPSPETFYEWALGWREADDHDGIEGQESQMLWRVCSTVHRRLREHMTGDAS
jgi:hypothetical protein